MEIEFELLKKYMNWWIDRLKPVTLEAQIKIFGESGYIETGSKAKDLPDFNTWKKFINKPIQLWNA